jgi:arylsulfatase A-like enzyme
MPQTAKPNLIWFLGDQHRGQALSCMGDPNVSTPNFDRLAIQGMHFPQALANCPWCTPFRGTMLTGLHAHRAVWKTPQQLDPALPLISDHLRAAGYRTRYLGKWHLDGPGEPSHRHVVPRERRGRFDEWLAYENNNNQEDVWLHGHDEDGREVAEFRLGGYETDRLTDLAIERLRREAAARARGEGRPFFLVVSVQPPHNPYVAPAADMARHRPALVELRPNVPPIPRLQETARRELAGYYAQIENLDRNLGRLCDALDELGLADDTWLMAFADHGDMHHSHGYREKSVPYEEAIRIPMVVRGHRRHHSGRLPSLFSAVDIAPTALGLCGVPVPAGMDGFDYSRWATAPWDATALPGEPESAFLQHLPRKKHPYTLDRPWRAVVTRDGWKYACIPGAPLGMYDLNEDPYELDNKAFKQAYIAQRTRLHALLAEWIRRTGDEFALPEL